MRIREEGSLQRQANIHSGGATFNFFFFFFFMQRVDMKENLEERQKCCIHFPPLSRVSTGTLNIQLRPFRRYIAITLIIIYLYFGSA